jgi:hypothetical protein
VKFNDVWAARVKGPAKVVLLCIAWRQNGNSEVRLPLSVICADTGLGKSTVCRALTQLEMDGRLFRKSSGGRAQSVYSVNIPQLSQSGTQTPFASQSGTPVERGDSVLSTEGRKPETAKSRLEPAQRAIRRRGVLNTFIDLCEMYETDVKITVSMLAREMGSRPAQVRADINYLIKNRDIPFDQIERFGNAKPNHRAIARVCAERAAFKRAKVATFERGGPT